MFGNHNKNLKNCKLNLPYKMIKRSQDLKINQFNKQNQLEPRKKNMPLNQIYYKNWQKIKF